MAKRTLRFTISQIIIDGKQFTLDSFKSIDNEELDKEDVSHRDERGTEMLLARKISKKIVSDRFVALYFLEGRKFPYSDIVVNDELEENKNPRDPNQLEMDEQFFVILDKDAQKIYISDSKKKYQFISWLDSKINAKIEIKSILKEDEFLDKISKVDGISFTVVPNLFNFSDESILSRKLMEDIYGFNADSAKIELRYKDGNITTPLVEKIKSLISRRDEFKEITVIGRNDNDFENVFNLEEVSSKIIIDVKEDNETKMLNEDEVFETLIGKIKQND